MNNLNFIEPQVSSITLNNGVIIPQVGLGTFLIPKEKVVDTIGTAFSLGYRLVLLLKSSRFRENRFL